MKEEPSKISVDSVPVSIPFVLSLGVALIASIAFASWHFVSIPEAGLASTFWAIWAGLWAFIAPVIALEAYRAHRRETTDPEEMISALRFSLALVIHFAMAAAFVIGLLDDDYSLLGGAWRALLSGSVTAIASVGLCTTRNERKKERAKNDARHQGENELGIHELGSKDLVLEKDVISQPSSTDFRGRAVHQVSDVATLQRVALQSQEAAIPVSRSDYVALVEEVDRFMKANGPDETYHRSSTVMGVLLCASCNNEIPADVLLQEIHTDNLEEGACHFCSCKRLIYVYSNLPKSDICEKDVSNLLARTRQRGKTLWLEKVPEQIDVAGCNNCYELDNVKTPLSRNEGFCSFEEGLLCEICWRREYKSRETILENLAKNRDYYGRGLIERLREWRLGDPVTVDQLDSECAKFH